MAKKKSKSILIANLGTSDLSIKINNYYIPVTFNNEPNIILPEAGDPEADVWKTRTELINHFAQNNLDIELTPRDINDLSQGFHPVSFREMTEKILKKCQLDKSYYDCLSPGRIWGVIDTALNEKFNLSGIYLFVTNQNPADKGDTIFLLQILQRWLNRKYGMALPKITPVIIDFKAIDQDKLFDFYYNFFSGLEIDPKDRVLLSIKGGTQQMSTALYAQATASMYNRQILLQPQLNIVRAMHGEPSDCQLVSYWRYLRSQKYQAVTQLLERWDFVGGKQILKVWAADLQSLADLKIIDSEHSLKSSKDAVNQAVTALELADYYLNMDYRAISQKLELPIGKKVARAIQAKSGLTLTPSNNDPQELILNLFAQSKIYWDLNQVATFLSRLGTFFEKSQYLLIEKLDGDIYLMPGAQILSVSVQELQNNQELYEKFRQLQGTYWKDHYTEIKISSRPPRTNFLEALLLTQISAVYNIDLIHLWKKLDFWFESRNQLIHDGDGISKERLSDFWNRRPRTCPPDQIIPTMLAIRNIFVSNQVRHYHVYAVLRDWVNTTLKDDLKPPIQPEKVTTTLPPV
jgi:hypothetical protein